MNVNNIWMKFYVMLVKNTVMQRDENLVYINNGVNGQQIDAIHITWVTVRPGRSTPADLVQSRFTQIGPRSV